MKYFPVGLKTVKLSVPGGQTRCEEGKDGLKGEYFLEM